jgi:hypothetical protein
MNIAPPPRLIEANREQHVLIDLQALFPAEDEAAFEELPVIQALTKLTGNLTTSNFMALKKEDLITLSSQVP